MSEQVKFGEYLRQQREAKGLTQPEAAAQIGIEQSYLSKLETGKSFPSDDVYARLANGLGIDTGEMCARLPGPEIQKLKDIAAVRNALLTRHRFKRTLARGWLLAGLFCLMLGAAGLGVVAAQPSLDIYQFHYRSTGIIKTGEPLDAFDIVDVTLSQSAQDYPQRNLAQQAMIERIDEEYQTLTDFRGKSFIENTDEGRRKFELFDQRLAQETAPSLRWLLAPSLMFFAGSFGCFYIAYRWE